MHHGIDAIVVPLRDRYGQHGERNLVVATEHETSHVNAFLSQMRWYQLVSVCVCLSAHRGIPI